MRKLGIACIILLLALVTMGISCAGWTGFMFLSHSVETGVVSAGIRSYSVNDYGRDPTWFGGVNPGNKDLGYIVCSDGPSSGKLDGISYSENVDVEIYGYPSYAPGCTLEVANCGTIPVTVDQFEIDWEGELTGNVLVGKWTVDYPDGNRDQGKGFSSLEKAIRDACIDPEQSIWLNIQFRVSDETQNKNALLAAVKQAKQAFDILVVSEAYAADGGSEKDAGVAAQKASEQSQDDNNVSNAHDKPAAIDSSIDENPEESQNGSNLDTPGGKAPDDAPEGSLPVQLPGEVKEQPSDALGADEPGANPVAEPSAEGENDSSSSAGASGMHGGGSGSGGGKKKEIACRSATGKITVTYSRWNEKR